MSTEMEALERLKWLYGQRAQTHVAKAQYHRQQLELQEELAAAVNNDMLAVEGEIKRLKEATK